MSPTPKQPISSITRSQLNELNRILVQDFDFPLEIIDENAGFLVARYAESLLGSAAKKKVVALVGPGSKGAQAIIAARRLANWGAQLTIVLSKERSQIDGHVEDQLKIIDHLGVRILEVGAFFPEVDLIIDGLLGFEDEGQPTVAEAHLIDEANSRNSLKIAIDIPSGLDADAGRIYKPTFKAGTTITLGYPKKGLLFPTSRTSVGKLYVADVSIPGIIWKKFGLNAPDFSGNSLIDFFESRKQ